jgi:hypothetical protein
MVLAACEGAATDDKAPETLSSGTDATTATESLPTESETETEELNLDHEMLDYFELTWFESQGLSGEVSRYEGVIPSYDGSFDMDHDLVVIKTQDLDNLNVVTDTYTVYDVAKDEKIFESSISNLLYEHDEKYVDMKVRIFYPVICVETHNYVETSRGEYVYESEYTYYLVTDTDTPLCVTRSAEFETVECGNGLVMLTLGGNVFFVDRHNEIVRTVDAIVANGYAIPENTIFGEYQGYIYALDTTQGNEIRVYNREGVCSAIYTRNGPGSLNAHILNNGNVLIQDIAITDSPYGEYDFVIGGDYCTVTTYIMSLTDGELVEVDVDFVVDRMGTAYEQTFGYSEMPFRLKVGRENQAFIYRFAGGKLAYEPEYVCMTSDAVIEYTVKNETVGVNLEYAYMVSETLYAAPVKTMGSSQYYLFDLDGNKIAPYSGTNTEKYFITNEAIYTTTLKLVYDFAAEGYTFEEIDWTCDAIFLSKMNFETGYIEHYVFDAEKREPVLLTDDKHVSIDYFVGLYWTYDAETGIITLNNTVTGEVLVEATAFDNSVVYTQSTVIVSPIFEDENIIYIIK